ncbi:hypothetical protein TWF481_004893 [Arthrobotrys musiformis]|uniref:Uncharacterized protein n=1 Tax=Arthrobotrys musiformis TaxID=47236 RepID=A0AAV9WKW4_9PEZI
MHFSTLFTTATVVLVGMSDIVSGHCVFIDAWGSARPAYHGHGAGFMFDTPRKGNHLFPHQRDITVFDQTVRHTKWNKKYLPNGCGVTGQSVVHWYQKNNPAQLKKKKAQWVVSQKAPAGAFIDIKNIIDKMAWWEKQKTNRVCLATKRKGLAIGMPKVVPGGTLTIVAYQVNIDGAGPFHCKLSSNAHPSNWVTVPVTSCKWKGKHGKNCPGHVKTSFNWGTVGKTMTFTVKMPHNLNCVGKSSNGKSNICIVRCENVAVNGPFGGCIPVEQIRATPQVVRPPTPVRPPVGAVTRYVTVLAPPRPPPVRVTTVTEQQVVIYVIRNGVRVPITLKRGATLTLPAQPVVTTTITAPKTVIYIVRDGVRKPYTATKGEKVVLTEAPPLAVTTVAEPKTIVLIVKDGTTITSTATKGQTIYVPAATPTTITVTEPKSVIYIVKDGATITTTVTKGETVVVTSTASPVVSTVVETATGTPDAGGKSGEEGEPEGDKEEGGDGEAGGKVAEEPEDKNNEIESEEGGEADQKPTDEEIEAAIGGEDISDEEREALKNEKVSKEDKEDLDEAGKAKEEEPTEEPTEDSESYF